MCTWAQTMLREIVTTVTTDKYGRLICTLKEVRVWHIGVSGILPIIDGRGNITRTAEELSSTDYQKGIGFVVMWACFI